VALFRSGLVPISAASIALAACGSHSIPPPAVSGQSYSTVAAVAREHSAPTSILKTLKKDVVIGSTVDPSNGDEGPRGISVVPSSYSPVMKGQILVCNFEDSGGAAGNGTTVEILNPKPGSMPVRFAQSSEIQGCAGTSVSPANEYAYVSGFSSGLADQFTPAGKLKKTWGKPLVAPISDVDGACPAGPSCLYSSEPIFVADASTGGIVVFNVSHYGNKKEIEVISGFAVNKKKGWSALGPSGLAYDYRKKGTLYAVDGVDNTVVSFDNVTALLVASEIVVLKGGKTFDCKYPKTTCGTLVFAGSPLDAPVAMARLPNGNLVVANSAGKSPNTLVELSTTGKVLDTKVVDTSSTAGIFGLCAIGKNAGDAALYYTDTNDNNLHELER
jgi:hypothetical protein